MSREAANRLTQLKHQIMSSVSAFEAVELAPPDVIFEITAAYDADQSTNKVNLGVGAYRDDSGKPWVLPVVKKADAILRDDKSLDHEYLPIAGLPSFTEASARLAFGGDSVAIKEHRIASLQSISGTGANHLGALFMSKFYKDGKTPCYLSNPTWANHKQIWNNVSVPLFDYPYFHTKTRGLDIDGLLSAMESAADGSIFLLHGCAHNPTGVDPTQDQWVKIADVMERKRHFPFLDVAYQGFASGDLDKDGWAIQYFVERGFELIVCQSYAKNFGLYGERVGCFHFVSKNAETAKKIKSQIEILQRSEISNPPAYGARIVSTVLNDKALFNEWYLESYAFEFRYRCQNLREMSHRIIDMRQKLFNHFQKLGTPGTWNHITDQIGMFSFTGLNGLQVKKLRAEFHIYMTQNGRISMAGLNSSNVEYFAKAVDQVIRESN
ncbi:Aspartate aminotransferase, cytoplasmic [Neolecta irregularis DAH-3]|uniref:Aspartate aminotransferase n=1 Tax=Neolecta irregularis (strain DAH-3) TaxID=1198029 RepID=A0A1U7LUC0_NEOID|nr:Aspartate aminotransferase, cytoplasmic [Neolecta irregularis DAH-3]|eukprot:OLL26270.1 Aspartate aminotransferase, cytoplasmic [Neolecta irregularis DAH-3]